MLPDDLKNIHIQPSIVYDTLFDYRAFILFLLILILIFKFAKKMKKGTIVGCLLTDVFSAVWYCILQIKRKNGGCLSSGYDKFIGLDSDFESLIWSLVNSLILGFLTYLICLLAYKVIKLVYKVIKKIVSKKEE